MDLMLLLAAEAHEQAGEGWFQEYLELLQDPAHLALELTLIIIVDVIIGMLLWPFAKNWLKKHDAKKHVHEHCEDVHQQGLFD